MKKNSLNNARVYKLRVCSFFAAVFPLLATSHPALATVDLDRQYALETVGFLRAVDNVDGLFTDYISSAYRDYFSRQSRFVLQDLGRIDTALTHSKIPYAKVIQDDKVLSQVARSTHSQSMIRTKVTKEGDQYRFNLEWLHAPRMLPLATQSMILHEPKDGLSMGVGEVQSQIESSLDQMVRKLPWLGHVTGRDNGSVTINIGANAGLHKGDTLVIATLDDVKRHPLLNTIVDWKLTRTGTIEIDSVDESIAFAHVVDEDAERRVQHYQKITQIIPGSEDTRFKVIHENTDRVKALEENPRLGFIKASLWPGGYSRQYSSQTTTSNSRDGGGFFLGAKLDGELWFTREFFSEMGFGYGFWNYSHHQPLQNSGDTLTGGANVFTFKLDGGYSYLVTGDFTGPKALVKLGYRSGSYSLPTSSTEFVGPISFKSLFLGLGGDLPIRNEYGVDLDFDIGLLNGVTQSGFSDGDTDSVSSVSFSLGGYYRVSNRMKFRAALEVMAESADFTDKASISQKIITFTPSLVYYF